MVVWRRIGSHRRIKRTSSGSGPPPQDNAVSLNGCGCGCGRRGYKTFLRLLREFIEATVYWNDLTFLPWFALLTNIVTINTTDGSEEGSSRVGTRSY